MEQKETYTPPTSPEQASQDIFEDAMQMQASESAQRILEPTEEYQPHTNDEPTETRQPSQQVRKNRAVAAALGVTIAATGVAAGSALAEPSFSDATTEYTIGHGEGLYDAAESIKGIDSIGVDEAVAHIKTDPANIDVLKDGLQPGEQIIIPVSVEGHENDK